MIIQERARLYNESEFGQKYPDSRFMISDRWVSATWIMGNDYRSLSGYYGSYPPGYIKRAYVMLPDAKQIVHLFSGSLTEEHVAHPGAEKIVRVDANPNCRPDIIMPADATELPYSRFDVVLADPPYSVEDAEHYGRPLCNKKKVLKECRRILHKDGLLFWMDQSQPMYRKEEWKWVGVISMYRSINHRMRGVLIYQKR
jgi:hypothetical protein